MFDDWTDGRRRAPVFGWIEDRRKAQRGQGAAEAQRGREHLDRKQNFI